MVCDKEKHCKIASGAQECLYQFNGFSEHSSLWLGE